MRLSAPTPTDEPLPVANANAQRMPNGLSLRGDAVAQFDALLHELNPNAVRVDPERVQNLCVWLASLPPHAATASAPAHAASHARPVGVAFMVVSLRR